MSSSRVGLRFLASSRAALRNFGQNVRNQSKGFRFQSTDASAAAGEQQSTFQKMWNSPVGVKTVHFWYGFSISIRKILIDD
jgi:hypothetical protein